MKRAVSVFMVITALFGMVTSASAKAKEDVGGGVLCSQCGQSSNIDMDLKKWELVNKQLDAVIKVGTIAGAAAGGAVGVAKATANNAAGSKGTTSVGTTSGARLGKDTSRVLASRGVH